MRFCALAIAICFLTANVAADLSWDSLKVTFGIVFPQPYNDNGLRGSNSNGLVSDVYVKHPRTLAEASSNWAQLNPGAACAGANFNGVQYYDTTKPLSIVLLFDTQGTIAGLQTFVPKSEAIPQRGSVFRYDLTPMFNNVTQGGIDYFVVTVYFVDPSTICTAGRSADDLTAGGTGSGLWVQNGTTVSDAYEVPKTRVDDDDYAEETGYTNNNCGSSMGWHNFYRTEEWDANTCTVIHPIFLLYNNTNDLHGFGIPMRGNFSAKAFEHPSALAIAVLAGKHDGSYPVCSTDMANTYKVGTVHVFFVDRADQFSCPLSWDGYAGPMRAVAAYTGNSLSSLWSAVKNFSFNCMWNPCPPSS